MTKTRDELLAMAETFLELTTGSTPPLETIANAQMAQACVMLAKEMRENDNAPTYLSLDNIAEAIQRHGR